MFLMFSIPPGLPQRPSAFHISCPNVSQSPWRYMDFTTGFPTQGSTTLITCKEAAVCHKWAMTNPGVTLQWMHDVHLNRCMVTSDRICIEVGVFFICFSCIISKDFELTQKLIMALCYDFGESPASPILLNQPLDWKDKLGPTLHSSACPAKPLARKPNNVRFKWTVEKRSHINFNEILAWGVKCKVFRRTSCLLFKMLIFRK